MARSSPSWVSCILQLSAMNNSAFTSLSKLIKKSKKRIHARSRSQAEKQLPTRCPLTVAAQNYFFLQSLMESATEPGVNEVEAGSERLVISLTSIEARLYEVATTVESLLRQTVRADAIVLWLDRHRWSMENLPIALLRQMERGLSVRFCDDIGPHTKLIPALREFPEATIITVDDDVLYPFYLVERLMRAFRADPSRIYCTRARRLDVDRQKGVSYLGCPNLHESAEGIAVFPLGVGGVLYPPGIFEDEEIFNLAQQKRLAPKADDIWFKAMSLRKGVVCQKIHFRRESFPLTPFSQEVELQQYNVREGGNDQQLRATFDHYGLWSALDAEQSSHDLRVARP